MSPGDFTTYPTVLALAADMIFSAKIKGAGQATGVPVTMAGNASRLIDLAGKMARQSPPLKLIIVDLDTRNLDIPATLAALKAAAPSTEIIAFVSHVREDLITEARTHGADKVMARSAFTRMLPQLLKQ